MDKLLEKVEKEQAGLSAALQAGLSSASPLSLPADGFAELVAAGERDLSLINKKQSDISLQVEELYDVVEGIDTKRLNDSLETESRRSVKLVNTVIGLCDILEDFWTFAKTSGDGELASQADMMRINSMKALETAGFSYIGEAGQPFDPNLHTIRAAAESPYPRECVAEVLLGGYRYLGDVVRKAAVVISDSRPD